MLFIFHFSLPLDRSKDGPTSFFVLFLYLFQYPSLRILATMLSTRLCTASNEGLWA